MEQKTKKYSELNRYEKAMTNATLEQRIEAMANDLKQMALALGMSIHVDATFHDWRATGEEDETHSSVAVTFIKGDDCTRRDIKEQGDLFGAIEEAMSEKDPSD